MQLKIDKVTEILYLADEFCQEFSKSFESYLIGNKPKKAPWMSDSKVIGIMILFHFGILNTFIFFMYRHIFKENSPKQSPTIVL